MVILPSPRRGLQFRPKHHNSLSIKCPTCTMPAQFRLRFQSLHQLPVLVLLLASSPTGSLSVSRSFPNTHSPSRPHSHSPPPSCPQANPQPNITTIYFFSCIAFLVHPSRSTPNVHTPLDVNAKNRTECCAQSQGHICTWAYLDAECVREHADMLAVPPAAVWTRVRYYLTCDAARVLKYRSGVSSLQLGNRMVCSSTWLSPLETVEGRPGP